MSSIWNKLQFLTNYHICLKSYFPLKATPTCIDEAFIPGTGLFGQKHVLKDGVIGLTAGAVCTHT